MASSPVVVHIPQSVYQRLERAAARLKKPVDILVAETLEAALPDDGGISPELVAEMKAVEQLNKAGLQQVVATDMRQEEQESLDALLDTQNARPLTPEEIDQLETLRHEYERLLLRKARAFALLADTYPASAN